MQGKHFFKPFRPPKLLHRWQRCLLCRFRWNDIDEELTPAENRNAEIGRRSEGEESGEDLYSPVWAGRLKNRIDDRDLNSEDRRYIVTQRNCTFSLC